MKKNIDDIIRNLDIPDVSDADILQQWDKMKPQLPVANTNAAWKTWLFGNKLLVSSIVVATLLVGSSIYFSNSNKKSTTPLTETKNKVKSEDPKLDINTTLSNTNETNTFKSKFNLNTTGINQLNLPKTFDTIELLQLNKTNSANNNIGSINVSETAVKQYNLFLNQRKTVPFYNLNKNSELSNFNTNSENINIIRHTYAQHKSDEMENVKTKINIARMPNQISKPNPLIFGISVRYIPAKISGNISFWNQIGAGIVLGVRNNRENSFLFGLEYSEYNISSIQFSNNNFTSYGSGSNTQYASDITSLNRVGGFRIPLQYKINKIPKISIRFGTYIEKSAFYYGSYYYKTTDQNGSLIYENKPAESNNNLKQQSVNIFPNNAPFSPVRNLDIRKFDAGLTFSFGYVPDKRKNWEISVEGNYGMVDFTKTNNNNYYNKKYIAIDLRRYFAH